MGRSKRDVEFSCTDFFWGGGERVSDGKLSVCKVTFGAEPKDDEIYNFFIKITIGYVLVQLWQLK